MLNETKTIMQPAKMLVQTKENVSKEQKRNDSQIK